MHISEVVIQSAAQIDPHDFVHALNTAYADYYVPINLSLDSFQKLVIRESVDLDASAVALLRDHVIGMGLLGMRGRRGWIGWMGVLPEYRGQGVGRQLMERLIGQGRDLGLVTIQLEVITQNDRAHALYRSLEFETARRLLVLFRPDSPRPPVRVPAQPEWRTALHDPGALLDQIDRLVTVPRPWQREHDPLRAILPRLSGLGIWDSEGTLVGACLYRREGDQVGLLDLAAATSETGEVLLAALLREHPSAHVSYVNIPEDDPLLPIILAAGFTETLSQYEMFLHLSPETPV